MRAFLARRAGTGTGGPLDPNPDNPFDPFRPDVDFALYGQDWAAWDIEHPTTNAVIGYIVVWTGNTAPIEAIADLGDPTNRASMRSVTLGRDAAVKILDVIFGPGNYTNGTRNAMANRTGVQTIRYLNRSDPVMAAQWGDTIANLVDASD